MADSHDGAPAEQTRPPIDTGIDLTLLDPATLSGPTENHDDPVEAGEEPVDGDRLWAIIDDEGPDDSEVPDRASSFEPSAPLPAASIGRRVFVALLVIGLMATLIWVGAKLGW